MNKDGKIASLKKFIRAVSFMLVLCLLLSVASIMFEPKNNTLKAGQINPNAHGYISEPKNTLDIVIIGNSDAYTAFAPMQLWNEYGYTSFVSGLGRERAYEAVEILDEVLKTQKPKLVILETDLIFTDGTMRYFSRMQEVYLTKFFPVFENHDNWKVNPPSKFFKAPKYKKKFVTKGQLVSHEIVPGKGYNPKFEKNQSIPKYVSVFLDQFVNRCRDEGIEVLFAEFPSMSSWSNAKHKEVQKYADSRNITFIDYDRDNDELVGVDWSTDTYDGGNHLNVKGSEKLTKALGKYISENYDIEDKRENSKFEYWNKQYKEYKAFLDSGKSNKDER